MKAETPRDRKRETAVWHELARSGHTHDVGSKIGTSISGINIRILLPPAGAAPNRNYGKSTCLQIPFF